MRLLIATHNISKFARYKNLLSNFSNIEIVSLRDLGISVKVDEPFDTAHENAVYKAEKYSRVSGLPTLAIDESVRTNFLPENEQPGVYVRRFADHSKEMTDEETLSLWKTIFMKYPESNKEFIWDYSIVYLNPDSGRKEYVKAIAQSQVADDFSGICLPGYPMSSFLIVPGTSKPHAELTDGEKLNADKAIFAKFLQNFGEWIA